MSDKDESIHWLVRPAAIRKLWYAFSAVLASIVLLQAVIPVKGYFVVDGWFGFGAVYGFVSCLLMVLVAKVLGVVLKRPQEYFSEPGDIPDAKTPDNRAQENTDGT
tara:strand:- start:70953 stop:71270 length:318 start_codon:yes stop_codon:yes gene_type:complete